MNLLYLENGKIYRKFVSLLNKESIIRNTKKKLHKDYLKKINTPQKTPQKHLFLLPRLAIIIKEQESIYNHLYNQYLSPVILSLKPVHGEVYSIQHYVIKFVSDLRHVCGFLRVLRFPQLIKLKLCCKLITHYN